MSRRHSNLVDNTGLIHILDEENNVTDKYLRCEVDNEEAFIILAKHLDWVDAPATCLRCIGMSVTW